MVAERITNASTNLPPLTTMVQRASQDDVPVQHMTASRHMDHGELSQYLVNIQQQRVCFQHVVSNCRFCEFKFCLSMAGYFCLDFVAAFLQAYVLGCKFTILPKEWKELFKNYPEIH